MFILGGDSEVLRGHGRKGERRIRDLLWECFGGPSDDRRWFALYGVHVRQLTATDAQAAQAGVGPLREIDFLVVDRERGFMVVEAKGGELRMHPGGTWESRGGGSDWQPCDSPLAQARGAESSLLRRISDRLGAAFKPSWIWHAPALALPFSDRITGSMPMEWHPDLLATSSQCADGRSFERWIEGVFAYAGEHYRPNDPARAAASVERALDACILPPFRAERSARKQAALLMRRDREPLDLPTPLNDFVQSKLRRRKVLVEGPAGTGKTYAGMTRIAHALRDDPSSRALYVCFNELLAEQVRDSGAAHGKRLDAVSFHGLCRRMAVRAGIPWSPPSDGAKAEDFYRSVAPGILADAIARAPLPETERPGMLVIDEAQDFHEDWIAALQLVACPDATVWCLYDPAQLLFANLAFDSGSAGHAAGLRGRLADMFGDPDTLSINQRMATRVFEFLRARAIIPHDNARCDATALDGFEPIERAVPHCDAGACVHDLILHAIDDLGFSPEQILVQAAVTPANPEHPLWRPGPKASPDPWNVRGRYMLRPIGHVDSEGNPNVIDMATAQKYKGCERPFVIVIRTKSMDGARLYTACTRARLGLAIVDVTG